MFFGKTSIAWILGRWFIVPWLVALRAVAGWPWGASLYLGGAVGGDELKAHAAIVIDQ